MSAEGYEGAERDPFALTASAEDYVPSTAIEAALEECEAALREERVPVVSGPTGLGKTLLLQLLARRCADRCQALYVPYCSLGPQELASLVLGLLDVSRDADPEVALLDAAHRVAAGGRRLLLLVDDAASLPGETAAGLAHWLNASGGALQLALAGLPGAALRHVRDAFGDRAEEVSLSEGLRPEEIRPYVEARLSAAGAEPSIRSAFDDVAMAELARVCVGNPRRLNLAAQAIMRNAYGAEAAAAQQHAGRTEPAGATTQHAGRARPSWEDLAGVGEYRFVRGSFVDPKSGERLATPSDDGVWRETLMGGGRQPARAERQAPEPALEIDAGLGAELGSELDAKLEPLDVLDTEPEPDDAVSGADAGPDDAALAPRLEPPPQRRRRPPLFWIAAGIACAAFAVGMWSQLRGPAEPAPPRVVTLPELVTRPPQASPAAAPEPEAAVTPEPVVEPGVAVPPEPEVAATPAAEPAAEPEAAATLATDATAEAASPPPEMVPVAINATPWAVIEIDGEEVGETPLAGIPLSTGRHRFRARMPDGTVRERVVRIDADTATVVFE